MEESYVEDSAGYLEDQAGMYDEQRDYSEEQYNWELLHDETEIRDYEAGISTNWGW